LEQTITTTRTAPRHSAWWNFGVMAAILAASLLWLALDGGRVDSSGVQVGDSLTPATALGPSASTVPEFNLPALVSPPRTVAEATKTSLGASGDNLTMLVLGSAAVLAVTGFTVLRARRRRPGLVRVTPAKHDRLPALVLDASEQAVLSS